MLVDHERAWLALKEVVVSKASHGRRDLLAEMTRIEIESKVQEGERDFDPLPLHRESNGHYNGSATQS